jgi:general secretion pathway protein J
MTSQRAFTLIEVMVALAVVSIIGVLSFRAVAAAADTQQHLAQSNERWQDIVRLVRRIDSDLLQMQGRSGVVGGDARLTRLTGVAGERLEFSFLRGDAALGQLRRYGYRFENGRIDLLRWPGTNIAETPRVDALLGDVTNLNLRFFLADGHVYTVWPPDATTATELPAAVDVELELTDAGRIHRLVAIR